MGLYSDRMVESKPKMASQITTVGDRFSKGNTAGRRRSFPPDARERSDNIGGHDLRSRLNDRLGGRLDDRLGTRDRRGGGSRDDSSLSRLGGRLQLSGRAGKSGEKQQQANRTDMRARLTKYLSQKDGDGDDEPIPSFFQHDDRTGKAFAALQANMDRQYAQDGSTEPTVTRRAGGGGGAGGGASSGGRAVKGRGAVNYTGTAQSETRGNRGGRRPDRGSWSHDMYQGEQDGHDLRSRLGGLRMEE